MIYFHFRAKDCNATLFEKLLQGRKLQSFCDITKVMPIYFSFFAKSSARWIKPLIDRKIMAENF